MNGARTLAGLLSARAEARPDTLALRYKTAEGWVSRTWSETWEEARAVAATLHSRGVRPGDGVMLLVPEVHAAVSTLFGVWALGAVPSILGVPYRLSDLDAYLAQLRSTARKLDARALVLSGALADLAAPDGDTRLIVADTLVEEGRGAPFQPEPEAAPGPCLVQLTSGSTSHPRGVVLSHDRVMLHMAAMSEALPSPAHAVAVSWLPLHHDMGLLGGLLFPLFNDFPAHLMSPLDFRQRPFSWLEAMSETRATICAAPPSAYALCLQLANRAREAGLDLSAWEVAMIGAEPVSPELLRRFSDGFAPCGFRPEAFFPVYGLAEATVAVTFPEKLAPTVVDRVDRATLEREGRAVPSAADMGALELTGVGRPIPYTEVRLVDAEDLPVPDRTQGEVLVRSATLMRGYHGEPELTASVLHEGWLRTGDLGYRADGTLFITGRKKELIIKGGHNLIPSILEELASEVYGVRPGCVAAVGVRSEHRHTELAYVLAETKLEPAEHGVLGERIRERLRAHGIAIDHVLLVPPGTLPKTTSGKLKRRAISQAIASGQLTGTLA
ncbi:AMP-binding protein [Pyxidicoccus xibeiensis]|uniref:AMP-binding protein n=1 Tax=Pyxidicoccus xibeiensis TaxID=2906759 RepID=UPI0020A6E606|nr:AMP-binding protein [Pyxidicoccus xibeiensis]MCP3144878.1 AMP-binding protein [Pyxidicoccus xibeiensis]